MRFRSTAVRVATVSIVLTPFAIALAAHVVPDDPHTPAASPRTALRFGEYLVNLGRLPEGQPAHAVFRFANSGDSPLKILDFQPNCGCLKPRLDKLEYEPGEQGRFIVVADTAGEGSDRSDSLKQHFVDVRYDDGTGEKTARVHVKFVLPARRIEISPRYLLIYQGNDQPTTREITITDRRTSPLTVTSVECPPKIAKITSIETQLAATTDDPTRATISLTVEKAPQEDIDTFIRIRTNDPEQPKLYVPLVIQGPSKAADGASPLDAMPQQIEAE